MYYCGPATHTLFIGCTHMAGDDDFIESGKVGGWVGGNRHPGMCISFGSGYPYNMFMNFNTVSFTREMAAGKK